MILSDQAIVFAVLGGVLVLFGWGRFRYDVTALLALLALVLTGVVPGSEAFSGFGHPAVITVAAVLVISRGIRNAGVVDVISNRITSLSGHGSVQLGALCVVAAGLSAFINNVGALALLLPVAHEVSQKSDIPPSRILMPLSFAAILGGMMTMIGTPPNIIIASYRAEATGLPFGLFDFSWVGVPVAVVGVLFVSLLGWRFLPADRRGKPSPEDLFRIDDYVTEAAIPAESPWAGRTVAELEALADGEVTVISIVRNEKRNLAPSPPTRLREKDVLLLRSDPADLPRVIDGAKLEHGDAKPPAAELRSEDVGLMEAVVPPGSALVGRSPRSLRLRSAGGINLLAVARRGRPLAGRLRAVKFDAGDVLLLQGPADALPDRLAEEGLLPLARRHLRVGKRRRPIVAVGLFGGGLALAATGLLSAPVALVSVAVAFAVLDLVSVRAMYEAVDWPVIVLLGAMIPVGEALQSTGATDLLAGGLLHLTGSLSTPWLLVILIVITMTLSDVINNAATAVVMAPIAATVAERLGASADPFLMAVAIGASCAFLTPIGHQCNTLVMGPGGYRFGDYWRMGLPLEVLVVLVSLPALLRFWSP